MAKSALEEKLALQLRLASVPTPTREYRFAWAAMKRGWRMDFAWPELMIGVEVDGGSWSGGRHTRGKGFAEDCVKFNAATLLGYRVLHFTGDQIRSGYALETIEALIAQEAR